MTPEDYRSNFLNIPWVVGCELYIDIYNKREESRKILLFIFFSYE